jgi:hypothetical protein
MYEYKVVPAPDRAERIKGMKRPEDRFAHKIEGLLNDMATAGWSFLRAESLPSEERHLLRSQSVMRSLLIFYRETEDDAAHQIAPAPTPASEAEAPQTAPSLGAASRHDSGPQPRPEPPAPAPGSAAEPRD